PEEPREADERHQHAELVVGPTPPREQAAANERPADQQAEPRVQRLRAVVVAEDDRDQPGRANRQTGDDAGRELQLPAHPSKARSAAPDGWALGMKPRAPLRSTSGPKSATSRLETSTTAGDRPLAISRFETSKPSVSGSCTSSSTTSGRSSRARPSADAPVS